METQGNEQWSMLTPEQKKRDLYERQKATLDAFLARNAISREQYEKSLRDMTEQMGYAKKQEQPLAAPNR